MNDILHTTNINSKGYGTVPKLLMKDPRLNLGAKGLYAYFCSYAGVGDVVFPGRATVCADLGISKDTYTKYLKQLNTFGYINISQERHKGKFSHNVYTLCTDISVSGNSGSGEIAPINNNNIFNNNNSFKKEKIKEINKESFDSPGSVLSPNEENYPLPPIKEQCIKLIETSFNDNSEIQKLLKNYLQSRLEIQPNLSFTNFEASLETLKLAINNCENKDLLNEYTKEVILNATTRGYNAFKPLSDKRYKNTNSVEKTISGAKFGDFGRVRDFTENTTIDYAINPETGEPYTF